jgi:hypothetical protein
MTSAALFENWCSMKGCEVESKVYVALVPVSSSLLDHNFAKVV